MFSFVPNLRECQPSYAECRQHYIYVSNATGVTSAIHAKRPTVLERPHAETFAVQMLIVEFEVPIFV